MNHSRKHVVRNPQTCLQICSHGNLRCEERIIAPVAYVTVDMCPMLPRAIGRVSIRCTGPTHTNGGE